MNYRHTKLLASTSLTNNTTYTLNLNVIDAISRITILYKGLNGDNTPDGHPCTGVSKVELVEGSDVLESYSGRQIQATDYYDTGHEPVNGMTYVNGNYMWATLNMNFGRFLYDPMFALDPNRFKNLQLKITHNYSVCGSGVTASTLEIWADLFQDRKISPSGFLMNKELMSYTPGSGGTYKYIDLPTDYAIRRLTIFALLDDYLPHQVVNEIRIDENNLKQIPVDEKVSNILKTIAGLYGVYNEGILANVNGTADDFDCTPTYETFVTSMDVEDADKVCNLDHDSYGGVLDLEAETTGEFDIVVRGYAPHGSIPIMFGLQNDPSDWYDVRKAGSIQLRLMAGSNGSSTTVQVVLQQLRTY